MSNTTNSDRAEWARLSCQFFAQQGHTEGEELVTVMRDLLTDLRHLAAEEGIDFEQESERSLYCFEKERAEEETDDEPQ